MPIGTKRLFAFAAASALAAAPAAALTINLNDIGGVTGTRAEFGFAVAARYWESVLVNDAVVNFDVGFDDLGEDILGGTQSNLYTDLPITTYNALLAGGGASALDQVALSHLPALSSNGSVTAIVPQYFTPATQDGVASSGTRIAPDGTPISSTIALSTANLKALVGRDAALDGVTDAQIVFSSTFAFDFNPTNGIATNSYDFIGVAVHEMGHALGFLSGAQDFDYSVGDGLATDDYWWGYAADLFRYTAEGELNWAFDQPAYFSIDGGVTALNGAYWSTGETYGDSWQASHWKAPVNGAGDFTCSAPYEGIMNPYTCNGQTDITTGTDLALLDAIGWNLGVDVLANPGYSFSTAQMFAAFGAVPEPASWGMMVVGFGLLGAAIRRSRRPAELFTA
jgi:hypothetical protein